jgi:mRNA interferase HicA
MTSAEFKRWLSKRGCTFEPGKGGHQMFGVGNECRFCRCMARGRELGTGLVDQILKDLGLK